VKKGILHTNQSYNRHTFIIENTDTEQKLEENIDRKEEVGIVDLEVVAHEGTYNSHRHMEIANWDPLMYKN
jgi:hypothetical protein